MRFTIRRFYKHVNYPCSAKSRPRKTALAEKGLSELDGLENAVSDRVNIERVALRKALLPGIAIVIHALREAQRKIERDDIRSAPRRIYIARIHGSRRSADLESDAISPISYRFLRPLYGRSGPRYNA
jgi:hypothetical protein